MTAVPLTLAYLHVMQTLLMLLVAPVFDKFKCPPSEWRNISENSRQTKTNSNRRSKGEDITVQPTLFDWQLIKIQKKRSSELLA